MLSSPDLKELLSIFTDHKVRYLVVGGYAVMRYAEPRYTKDLDLWVSTRAENARAVCAALMAFGAPLEDLTADDFAEEGYFYQMGRAPFRLDIMMSLPGVEFESAWERREVVDLAGLAVPFISRGDLIVSKRASGRPQDLIDVEKLEKAQPRETHHPRGVD